MLIALTLFRWREEEPSDRCISVWYAGDQALDLQTLISIHGKSSWFAELKVLSFLALLKEYINPEDRRYCNDKRNVLPWNVVIDIH